MRRIFLFLLSLMVLSGIFAGARQESKDSADKPLKIYFLLQAAESSAIAKAHADVAAKYKEIHQDFSYQPEYIADAEAFFQKLRILISSNEIPDWFVGDPDTFAMGLRDEKLIANIGALLDELGKKDRFFPLNIARASFEDGTKYQMGVGAALEYFWYHPSLFSRAGIQSKPKTWDEFYIACDALKAAGIAPIAGTREPWHILRYAAFIPFRMTGNKFIMEARTGKTKFNSEVGLAAAEFIQKMTGYFQEGWAGVDFTSARNHFMAGNSAIWYVSTGPAFEIMIDGNGELIGDIDYFTLPMLDGYTVTNPADSFTSVQKSIMISTKAMENNPVKMKDYVSFWIDNFSQATLKYNFLAGQKLPPNVKISQIYQETLDNFSKIDPIEYPRFWDILVDSATREVLMAETLNLAVGAITPVQWATRLDTSVSQNAESFGLK